MHDPPVALGTGYRQADARRQSLAVGAEVVQARQPDFLTLVADGALHFFLDLLGRLGGFRIWPFCHVGVTRERQRDSETLGDWLESSLHVAHVYMGAAVRARAHENGGGGGGGGGVGDCMLPTRTPPIQK